MSSPSSLYFFYSRVALSPKVQSRKVKKADAIFRVSDLASILQRQRVSYVSEEETIDSVVEQLVNNCVDFVVVRGKSGVPTGILHLVTCSYCPFLLVSTISLNCAALIISSGMTHISSVGE